MTDIMEPKPKSETYASFDGTLAIVFKMFCSINCIIILINKYHFCICQ